MGHADDQLARLGAAVRAARLERGLSQEDLADLVGIHRTYVGDVERGQRNVGLRNIVRLANALDLTAADLLMRARL